MRPIDADKIPWLNYPPHVEGFQTITKMAIDEMPTVVAEPVIRCKDCKYNPMSLHEPDHMKESYVHCFSFKENDYCSWAERRDNA